MITYEWRGPFTSPEVGRLHTDAFGDPAGPGDPPAPATRPAPARVTGGLRWNGTAWAGCVRGTPAISPGS